MSTPTWLKSLVGTILTAIVAWLGIASNLFGPEIRCCLGIESCPPPPCIQKVKGFFGIDSSGQYHSIPPHSSQLPLPVKSQYEKCKERFDQSPCQGILTADGKCFSGELRQKYQGQGFSLTYDGDECYNGLFQEGKFHGDGLLLYKDNTIYQGKFQDGQRHGQGKMTGPNGGVVYEGDWINGKHK